MSGAKDTVMSDAQIGHVAFNLPICADGSLWITDNLRKACLAQAEITWKARDPEIVEARRAGHAELDNLSRRDFLKLPMKLRRRLLAEQLMFMDEQDRQKIRDMHNMMD